MTDDNLWGEQVVSETGIWTVHQISAVSTYTAIQIQKRCTTKFGARKKKLIKNGRM
jgi:hypothetical protein